MFLRVDGAIDHRIMRIDAHDDGLNRWSMQRIAPPARLAGLIRGYTDYEECTGGFTMRRELPHGEGVLIFNLGAPIAIIAGDGRQLSLGTGQAFVAGFHLRPALSVSSGSQRGIEIDLPLTSLRRLLALPMDTLLDGTVNVGDIIGSDVGRLGTKLANAPTLAARIGLIDMFLIHRLAATPALSVEQMVALRMLASPENDIMDVARAIGWSRKHLANRVRDVVGVGPRSFRRVLRFQRGIAMISPACAPNWAGLAIDAGYYDQSHLIREFGELAEMTPTDYLRRMMPNGGGLVEA
jgi:AraC-like DNA-binding protein